MERKLFIIIIFLIATSTVAKTKRALVIGLGQQQDSCWTKINGDADVRYVKIMLTKNGYSHIKTLVNSEATKANIVSAFKQLTRQCKPGDMVYVHFSGHGQQVRDMDGDERDHLDESWIPYDAYAKYCKEDKGEKHLIDDEVNELLSGVKRKIGENGKMLVVVDACHSGGSSRGYDEDELVTRGAKDAYSVFVIPGKKHFSGNQHDEQWLTLSACQENQLCQEMKAPKVGILTFALYNGHTDIETIRSFVEENRKNRSQTPELTGETSKYNISDFFKR